MSDETIEEIFSSLKSMYARQKKNSKNSNRQKNIIKDIYIAYKTESVQTNIFLTSKLNELDNITTIHNENIRKERKKHINKILQVQDEVEANIQLYSKIIALLSTDQN
jgi:hypothetical protein